MCIANRIPFWCGLLIGVFALWLRRNVEEPPEEHDTAPSKLPMAPAYADTIASESSAARAAAAAAAAAAPEAQDRVGGSSREDDSGPASVEGEAADAAAPRATAPTDTSRRPITGAGHERHERHERLPVLTALRTMPLEILLCLSVASVWCAACWLTGYC
jgi:hypothetical protein